MSENFEFQGDFEDPAVRQAEQTLRLLANLPAPEDLTQRVHARVHACLQQELAERVAQGATSQHGFWSLFKPARRLQFAGAAVLMLAVAGSTWSVYRQHGPTAIKPAQTTGQAALPAATLPDTLQTNPRASSGFKSAAATRVPPTLKPMKLPPAPRKKPSASHLKPLARTAPSQPESTTHDATGTPPNR